MTDARLRALERRAGTGDLAAATRLRVGYDRAGFLPYQRVEFEPRALREEYRNKKAGLTFDESLTDLKRRGYDRHARPQEVFSLLCDHLEEKLGKRLQGVADDIVSYTHEWLSLAWECKGDTLIAYVDPVGLVWSDEQEEYVKDNFSCTETQEFDITSNQSRPWIDLKKFGEDFVVAHYGAPFNELPSQMREEYPKARVMLPQDGMVWPVGRGNLYTYSLDSVFYKVRASRGVRDKILNTKQS